MNEPTQHTPGPWKVMPCPINHGKHPYHDSRWIATADAEIEFSPYVENDWSLSSGALICQMRDTPEANARLIAAAPELLAALRDCVTESGAAAERSHEYALKRLAYVTEIAQAAIAKAEGSFTAAEFRERIARQMNGGAWCTINPALVRQPTDAGYYPPNDPREQAKKFQAARSKAARRAERLAYAVAMAPIVSAELKGGAQ